MFKFPISNPEIGSRVPQNSFELSCLFAIPRNSKVSHFLEIIQH